MKRTTNTTVTVTVTLTVGFFTDFFDFLREKGALIKYLINVEKRPRDLATIYKSMYCEEWIDTAFIWSETEEGTAYWNYLAKAWSDRLRKEQNKAYEEEKAKEVEIESSLI